MNKKELGVTLREMFDAAAHREKGVIILLFAVKYADVIELEKYAVQDILKEAQLPESYIDGFNKGLKLSKYVVAK